MEVTRMTQGLACGILNKDTELTLGVLVCIDVGNDH